jgi:regulatory protein
LRQQGVSSELTTAALAASGDEGQRAWAVWHKKFAAPPTDLAERARQTRFLQARGFSAAAIRQVLQGDFDNLDEFEE